MSAPGTLVRHNRGALWPNCGFANSICTAIMGNKIKTEADRRATPPLPGSRLPLGGGQRRSLERGAHTRSKKNAGKRPHSG